MLIYSFGGILKITHYANLHHWRDSRTHSLCYFTPQEELWKPLFLLIYFTAGGILETTFMVIYAIYYSSIENHS